MASCQQRGQAEDTEDTEVIRFEDDVEIMILSSGPDEAVICDNLTVDKQAKLKFYFMYNKAELEDYLHREDINLSIQCDSPERTQLSFSSATKKPLDRDFIMNIVEKWVLSRLHVKEVTKDSKEAKNVVRNLKSKRPIAIVHKKAAVFSSDKHGRYFIVYVPEQPLVDLLFKDLGITTHHKPLLHAPVSNDANGQKDVLAELTEQEENVELTLHEQMILTHLDFQTYAQDNCGYWDMNFQPNSVSIRMKTKPAESAKEEIRLFLKRVCKEPIELINDFCYSLLFEKEHVPNEIFYGFVKKGLDNKIDFYLGKENEKYFAYCRNEGHAKQVAGFVRKQIVYFEPQVIDEETGISFLKNWSGRKVQFEAQKDGGYKICCTSDISDEIKKLIGEEVPSPHLVLEFLKKFGEDIKQEMKKLFNLRIEKFTKNSIWIVGEKKNLKECKRFIKEKLLKKTVSVNASEEILRSRYEDLEKNIMENQCCWELLRHPDYCLANCTYIASWLDPIGKLKITVLKGIPSEISFDLHVVLSNDCLFPLENLTNDTKAWADFLDKGSKLLKANNKFKLGDVEFLLNGKSSLKSLHAAAVVISRDTHNLREVIKEDAFKKAIQDVLCKAEEKQIHTIGIIGAVTDSVSQPETIVKNIVLAAIDYAEQRNYYEVEELFICSEGDSKQMETWINDIFTKKKGYGRLNHIVRLSSWQKGDSNIKVKVKTTELVGVKADVIVNTARRDLNLKYGNVSKSILKEVGQGLQDECWDKYPKGIQHGQVAITSSHDLGDIKFIFHVALQEHENRLDTCLKRLKQLVKKCLYLTERKGYKSVAFPALGVGKLEYPRRETAAAMFEAVEEFQTECIHPKLKKVYFVVYGDKQTSEIFCNEEWRRSKKCSKEFGGNCSKYTAFEDVPFCLRIKTEKLSVKITTQELMKLRLPSFIVNIVFEKSPVKAPLKTATQEPKTWNDMLYLGHPKPDLHSVLEGLDTLLKEERIMTVALNTIKGSQLSVGMQVTQFVNYLDTFARQSSSILQKVIIIVEDEASVQNAHVYLQQEMEEDKPWHITSEEGNKVCSTIELIGKTEDLLKQAENYINSVLTETQRPHAKRISTDLSSLEAHAEEESQPSSTEELRDIENSIDIEDTCTVSAELNPGIVKMKTSMWIAWKSEIETKFNLRFNETETFTSVIGTLQDVLAFESNLENQFSSADVPLDSRSFQDDRSLQDDEEFYSFEEKEFYTSMSESEYTALLVMYQDKVAELCSRVHYVKENNYLAFRCSEASRSNVENQLKKMLSEIRQQNQQLDVKNVIEESETTYSFNGFEICVRKGDLLKENVNCILVAGHPKLDKGLYGLVDQVASHADQQFRDELKKVKTLTTNKCRLVRASGLGSIQTVALVTFMPKDIGTVLFDALNAIDSADNSTVALPFLASNPDKKGLELEECAGKYATALNNFQNTRKNLKKIIMVGVTTDSVQRVASVFDKYLMSKKESSKLQEISPNDILIASALEKGVKFKRILVKAISAKQLPIDTINSDAIVIFVDANNEDDVGFLSNIPAYENYTSELKSHASSQNVGKKIIKVYKSGHLPCPNVIHAVLSKKETNQYAVENVLNNILDEATLSSLNRLTILLPGNDEDASICKFSTSIAKSFVDVCEKKIDNAVTEILLRVPGHNTHLMVVKAIWDIGKLESLV